MCYMIERKYFLLFSLPPRRNMFCHQHPFYFHVVKIFFFFLDIYFSCQKLYLCSCWFARAVVCAACVEPGLVPGGPGEDECVPPLSLLTTEHGPRLEIVRHFVIIPSFVKHEDILSVSNWFIGLKLAC